MNKYDEIDAVYPPYTKVPQLLTDESVQLLHDSMKEPVHADPKPDSDIHK